MGLLLTVSRRFAASGTIKPLGPCFPPFTDELQRPMPGHQTIHRRFLSRNSIQFLPRWSCNFKIARVNQLRFQCDVSAIYRRGLRCSSRNTVTLSSSFTFEQAHSFCLQNRRALTNWLKSRWNRRWLQLRRDKNCIELRNKNRLCKQAYIGFYISTEWIFFLPCYRKKRQRGWWTFWPLFFETPSF